MGRKSDRSQLDHLYDVLESFGTAMLVTHTKAQSGGLSVRPMSVARIERHGEILFVSSENAPKIDEIKANPEVDVVFQGSTKFAAVQGKARIFQDRALVEELWSEGWKVYFPQGKEDPSLCFIGVNPQQGEFWDNSGWEGIKYAFEAAKAYVTGTTPKDQPEHNAKVDINFRS